jgi:DNA-binding NarL/FixJ family response regulator
MGAKRWICAAFVPTRILADLLRRDGWGGATRLITSAGRGVIALTSFQERSWCRTLYRLGAGYTKNVSGDELAEAIRAHAGGLPRQGAQVISLHCRASWKDLTRREMEGAAGASE